MDQQTPDPLINAIGGMMGIVAAFLERANVATIDELARALAVYGSVTKETAADEAAIIAQWVLSLQELATSKGTSSSE